MLSVFVLRSEYAVCICTAECRCVVLPVILRHLQVHMQEQRDLVMCAHILTSMLTLITKDGTVRKIRQTPHASY